MITYEELLKEILDLKKAIQELNKELDEVYNNNDIENN